MFETSIPVKQQALASVLVSETQQTEREIGVLSNQVESSTRKPQSKREEYIMGLYNKHKRLPAPYRSIGRQYQTYNPPKHEVTREHVDPDGPTLSPEFVDYHGGDAKQDKYRQYLEAFTVKKKDGRTLDDESIIESQSGGVYVAPRQSKSESRFSFSLAQKQTKREFDALKAVSNIPVYRSKALAFSYQGPNKITRNDGPNTRIPKRWANSSRTNADGTGVFFDPDHRPDTTLVQTGIDRVFAGRIETSGNISHSSYPLIDNILKPLQRQRFTSLSSRGSNTNRYTIGAAMNQESRTNEFQTSYTPPLLSKEQTGIPVVAGYSAPRQARIDVSFQEDREKVTRRSPIVHGHPEMLSYQRHQGMNQMLNKVVAPGRREYTADPDYLAPFQRNIDRPTNG